MKSFIYASALVASAHAGIMDKLSAVMKEDKAFSPEMQASIENLNEYGCWCFFDNDHGRGKGQAVDAIDETCKTLHDGYECAMRDAEEEGETCIPWEVSYNSAASGLSIAEGCLAANAGNNCAIRSCTVESTFSANLLNTFLVQFVFPNDAYMARNGFDFATVCATKKNGGGPSNKKCCGTYPDRFPFKTLNGDRKCCGTRTYNSLTLKCCDSDNSQVKFNC